MRKLLENVKEVCRKDVEVRRYDLTNMISESYKLLYDVPENSRLKKMVESHVVDVQTHPRDIDRLSEQLCTLKTVFSQISEGKSEEELLVPEEYFDTVEPKKNRVEINPQTTVEESKRSSRRSRKTESKKLKESDTAELTDDELEELAKHLETIRKERKEEPTSEKKEDTDESVVHHKRHQSCEESKKEDLDESAPSTDSFLSAHDNADNYSKHRDAFDEAYKILDKYVQEGENPDDLGVDVLYERATDEDKRKVYDLVTGNNKKKVVQISLDLVVDGDKNSSVLADNLSTFISENWGVPVAGCLPTGATWTVDEYEDMIGRSIDESKKLTEGYAEGTASLSNIQYAISQLEELADAMDSEGKEEISLSPNNSGLSTPYLALAGGFLDLNDLYKYFDESEEDFEESKKMRESKEYTGLNNFSKMSESKAFYKTFKKLHDALKEGKALTRQESIDLYKAANSAMTQLSIELEHNPEFLKTFTEATNLLSKDVDHLRESLSRDKAPSKSTMKSLAKFSEVLLSEGAIKESEEDEVAKDPDAVPKEDTEDFVGDDEGDIDHEPSPEEEEFDQEYADARQEVQDEMKEKYEDSEDPYVQDKLETDRVEVAELKGEDPNAESEEDIEDPESSTEGEESEVPDADVTDDELEELKKHLKEMRSQKKENK